MVPTRPSVRVLMDVSDTPPLPSSHSVAAFTSASNNPVANCVQAVSESDTGSRMLRSDGVEQRVLTVSQPP